jgi:repressor LexA
MTQAGELGATGQKIYDFIRDTHVATGLVPSVREIRKAVGVSSIGTVGYWLDRLEALNLISRQDKLASSGQTVTPGELGATGKRIYDFIRDTQAATGYTPSVREIRAAVGVSSTRTVGYWLDKLEALNLIRRDFGKNRSIQLRGPSPTVSVPLLGDVRAGQPRLAEDRVEGSFLLPRQLVGDGTLFMLRVRGDSMVGDQIAEGDYVVVREDSTAKNGDIVAALVPSYEPEATIKRLAIGGDGRVLLLPANPAYEPIEADDLQILGRVVTVLRRI